ncbi:MULTISPECIES: SHOCT domain-containing protein [Rhodomicrobium]|uniref:SHOCT domain-containing protein n=1 Tax=Rhodomicrobium TaxID=1068 RepID=UPI000B4B545F|nr:MULTISPECIES: SHOCT domain-containing protein [Rhodomicrobium]
MRTLTPEGERIVGEIAQRHGLSVDAVRTLLEAVANGGGTMAQFNHPELGGGGQWLRGGMTMVGDMFNHGLKAKVDAVCSELSELLGRDPFGAAAGSFQSQSQSGGAGYGGGASVFVPQSGGGSGHWWPGDLGQPAATGAQNSVRYAYFPDRQRLAIDIGGRVEVFDTLDHSIQGFGQQQSGDASISFTSQHGLVRVESLPRVDDGGRQETLRSEWRTAEATPDWQSSVPASAPRSEMRAPESAVSSDAIFAALERLAELKEKGVLTAEEFSAKKAELLKRL